jgi:Zn-dependent protease
MNFSLQIARAFGIPIQIHWSFGLVLAAAIYMSWNSGNRLDWLSIAWITISIFTLFACVVFHELGHALSARRYGVDTKKILLLPIGGLAILERLPEKPIHEFIVALAGPMVNLGLGLLFAPFLLTMPADNLQRLVRFTIDPKSNVFLAGISPQEAFLFGFVALNFLVALFNLLPAFPMDGGRVLRALLSMRMKRLHATRVATYFGQFFAVLLMLYGALDLDNLVTAFIGVFVFFAAAGEYRAVREDSLLENYFVKDIARGRFTKLYLQDSVQKALEEMRNNNEKYCLVFDEWQNFAGIIGEKTVADVIKKGEDAQEPVGRRLGAAYQMVFPSDPLKSLLQQIQQRGTQVFPVYDKGKITGVVDLDMIDRFLQTRKKTS